MDKEMPEDTNNKQDKIPSEYKQLWLSMPLVLRNTFIVIFIVLIIATFFAVFYFTDGLEELINMSKQIGKALE